MNASDRNSSAIEPHGHEDFADVDSAARTVAEILRDSLKAGSYSTLFRRCEALGCHLLPVHFYSPIPDTNSLNDNLWTKSSSLIGIDMCEAGQLNLLQNVFTGLANEFNEIPTTPTQNEHQFYLNNGKFDGTDALVLYCMIRHFRPRTIVEVGSGFSSRLSAQAALVNGNTHLVCIEPYPDPLLRRGFPGLSRLIETNVQNISVEHFEQLEANDILFIDSTHVVKTGSDVAYLILDVLPRLRPGVLVHVHDVFLPHEYPRDWVLDELRFWNEQYILQAFLCMNRDYTVLFANHFLGHQHGPALKTVFPHSPWWGGGSFWIQRSNA